MEIIAVAVFFAAALWYLYRRLVSAFKTDRPACGCGGCEGCSIAPKPDSGEKRPDEEKR